MGFIVDDHGKNIHGELRRESFSIFSDFGKEWSVELDLDKLDELIFVLSEIRRHRNEGKQYPEAHKKYRPMEEWCPKHGDVTDNPGHRCNDFSGTTPVPVLCGMEPSFHIYMYGELNLCMKCRKQFFDDKRRRHERRKSGS